MFQLNYYYYNFFFVWIYVMEFNITETVSSSVDCKSHLRNLAWIISQPNSKLKHRCIIFFALNEYLQNSVFQSNWRWLSVFVIKKKTHTFSIRAFYCDSFVIFFRRYICTVFQKKNRLLCKWHFIAYQTSNSPIYWG